MPAVVNQELCEGCAVCVDECPTEAITINGENKAVIGDECSDCGACVDVCPTNAITLE